MSKHVFEKVDGLIDAFKKDHNGRSPLYVILPKAEGDVLIEDLDENEHDKAERTIPIYKNVKIIPSLNLPDNRAYASDELPDTGS